MKLFAILFVSFLSVAAFSQTCPVGAGESKLTLPQIMKNFGSSITPADLTVSRNDLSDANIARATAGLDVAIACAQAVVAANGQDLLPTGMDKIPAAQRAGYVQMFLDYMTSFDKLLIEYKGLFIAEAGKPEASRSNAALIAKKDEVRAKAAAAHGDL